jgi:hypothetical protein
MDHGGAFSVVANESAPIVPRLFGGKPTGNKLGNVLRRRDKWWARGSNLGPLPCEADEDHGHAAGKIGVEADFDSS